jgi:hypothetical protein
MITAAVMFAVQAAMPLATCRIPGDPQQRIWSLEQSGDSWRVAFSAKSLDKPRVELPLSTGRPVITGPTIALSYASANGGRRVAWTIAGDRSTLDLHVSHGLEVNVERDLDPAVEAMNTDGEIVVSCERQNAGREPVTASHSREWQLAAGAARSVNLYESTSGRAYAVQTIGYSRELTGDVKLIGIRGRFAWGVEAMPLFAQFEPSSIYGLGFAPVVWRWSFPPQPRWSAFAELSMGGLWTSDAIPEDAGRANFTAHWGGGIRLRPRGAHALLIAYRFQHFSNGNQLGSNPGVNSHVILAGWSHRS